MNVLEKILEEIKDLKEKQNSSNQDYATGYLSALSTVEGIISGVKENDGWIPVEEKLPEDGELVKVTVHSSEWIEDFDSNWVPEEDRIYHQEEYHVYDGYLSKMVYGISTMRNIQGLPVKKNSERIKGVYMML